MNEILKMNSRSPRTKFVIIFLCCVTSLELVDKKSFGLNTESPQGQESKRFSLFYKVKEGVALTGHIISVHQTRTELDCSHKCLSNPKCASFNFEIQQSRSLSICELTNVSRMSSNNKLKRRGSFAYYEPLALRQRPKQDFAALCPTTGNLITEAATTQGKQEIMTSQDIAATPASSVPSTQPATTVTAAPVSNCGQHWHTYKSGCLRLFEDQKNWFAANQHCASFNTTGGSNGRLISIFSQGDNDRIVNLSSSQGFSKGEYFIGLNDLQKRGTYKWADGTNASFTNWNTGQPAGGRGVVMKMNQGNSDNGKWLKQSYENRMRFICECPDGPCA